MSKSNSGDTWRIMSAVALGMVCVACYSLAMSLYGNTLVVWWAPVAGCVAASALASAVMWRMWPWITGTRRVAVNYICSLVMATGVLLAAFFGCNYMYADSSSLHKESVSVERKFSKKHHRTRRVGRRTYTTGESYYTYHVEVRFADGRLKEMAVPAGRYNRLRTGGTMTLDMERGMWGLPVIRRDAAADIPVRTRRVEGRAARPAVRPE